MKRSIVKRAQELEYFGSMLDEAHLQASLGVNRKLTTINREKHAAQAYRLGAKVIDFLNEQAAREEKNETTSRKGNSIALQARVDSKAGRGPQASPGVHEVPEDHAGV